jgi:hypothetical protein
MSIISNIHTFTPLSKGSKAFAGQRLVKLIAKGENKSPNLQESLCVSIPLITASEVAEYIDRLLPHVVGMVQDAQDKIIREYRIETGRNELPQNVIDLDKVVVWLDENAAGDRVTSEYLSAWFKEEYAEAATQYIAHIMSLDVVNGEVPPVVEAKCNVLREMFIGWASPKYSPPIPQLKAMIRFTDSISDLDARMSAIATKCASMLAKKEAELQCDALGF